jgi:hypothetical protein
MVGLPPRLVVPDEVVAEKRAAAAQQAQMAQQMQMMQVGADAAAKGSQAIKNVSSAGVDVNQVVKPGAKGQ